MRLDAEPDGHLWSLQVGRARPTTRNRGVHKIPARFLPINLGEVPARELSTQAEVEDRTPRLAQVQPLNHQSGVWPSGAAGSRRP